MGVLTGVISMHFGQPIETDHIADALAAHWRAVRRDLIESAQFAVLFHLNRNGVCTFVVPENFRHEEAVLADGSVLRGAEAAALLVAQCFYFIRDITHRHYHHSSKSDNLTTIWPISDPAQWLRETLYELHRRIIVSRAPRHPRRQEDAIGLLAYLSAFENFVVSKYRPLVLERNPASYIPKYDNTYLKDSLNAVLETKRRSRTQRNIFAAALPAFVLAFLALANGVLGPDSKGWIEATPREGLAAFLSTPLTYVLAIFRAYQWFALVGAALLLVALLALTERLDPSELRPLRGLVRFLAPLGRVAVSAILLALAVALLVAGLALTA
jgi:hypothetical protein